MNIISPPIEERLGKLDHDLNEIKKKLDINQAIYKDQTKLRKLLSEQMEPITLIAKENMVTNCYKNEELRETREHL